MNLTPETLVKLDRRREMLLLRADLDLCLNYVRAIAGKHLTRVEIQQIEDAYEAERGRIADLDDEPSG